MTRFRLLALFAGVAALAAGLPQVAVPVGADQKQNLEISRDVAARYNRAFDEDFFPLPEPHILDEVAVVPGEAFGTPGYVRMSYALGDDDLVEGVTRLQRLLTTAD